MPRVPAVIVAAMLGTVVLASHAAAGPPTDQLKAQMDAVFRTLADPGLRGPHKVEERRAAVMAITADIFDFARTAELTLGSQWAALGPEQRREFVDIFRSFIERSYFTHLDSYEGHRIVYTGESAEGDDAVVRAKIVTKDGSEMPIDFRMLRTGADGWRLYDVKVEGMSLVANYRQQFVRVIRAASYADLVEKLRAKP